MKKCFSEVEVGILISVVILIFVGVFIVDRGFMNIEKSKHVTKSETIASVEPGQIWMYESSDPFNSIHTERLVLDVKDGYVLYKDLSSGYKYSIKLWLFLIDSHLKPKQK